MAAAVHSETPLIVTFNLRHFRSEHLEPFGIRAVHPESFLVEIFRQDTESVRTKLEQQASDRSRSLRELLDILDTIVPGFVKVFSHETK